MTGRSQLDIGAARRVTLDTADGPIAALRSGDQGPVVLLVPGYTGSKEDFGPLLDTIAGQGFQAVAVDLPGQYETPGPPDVTAYTPDALGRRMLVLMTVLTTAPHTRVHLVGHSFGGLVARAATISDPTAVASVVLMSSGPAALDDRARRRRLELLGPVLAQHGVEGAYAASLALARSEPGYVAPPAALADFLRDRFLAGAPAMLRGMGEAIQAEPDRVAELAASAVPTLVLFGAADDAWSPAVQADMARRLGADCVEVPEAAHSPALENPAATGRALIRFWGSAARVGRAGR